MRPSSHHEPMMSRGSRLLALPLVLVCVVAYLGSASHFFLVQHSTCLEHGELVHEGEVEQGTAPAKVRASFEDERFTRSEAARVSVHGTDEHCVHVFLRRVAPPPAGVMLSPEAAPPSGPLLEADGVAVEPQVAWLHLAPKSSPPRV